jgi:hypothetical protein
MAAKKTKAQASLRSHHFIFATFATSRENWLQYSENALVFMISSSFELAQNLSQQRSVTTNSAHKKPPQR